MSVIRDLEHMIIPLQDVELATNSFQTIIGKGGYGNVYKGILSLSNQHTEVAVKRLDAKLSGQGLKEFLMEIQLLTRYKHPNIVSLLGFCEQGRTNILIYEYAHRGSLDKYLRSAQNSTCQLTWKQRLNICIQVARGLDHLHNHVAEHERVIHRDIKSANVLIDKNWKAMIADFGLSRIGRANENDTFLVTNVCGTTGYCDPAYQYTGLLTKESDVYSFGVVLFEVLCGRSCFFMDVVSKQRLLPQLAQSYYKKEKLNRIIDPSLDDYKDSISMKRFSRIAYQCLLDDRKGRPTMDLVLQELEKSLNLLEVEEASKLQEHYGTCIADKDEEMGNEFFKNQKYQEAINHYTYYLKRKPEDAKVYSNRAACYVKLGALQEALKDAQKCIELDFSFTKGYAQKGEILYYMKDYEKALETCQNGLKFNAKDNKLLEGVRKCKQEIEKARGKHVDVTRERTDDTRRYIVNESSKNTKPNVMVQEVEEASKLQKNGKSLVDYKDNKDLSDPCETSTTKDEHYQHRPKEILSNVENEEHYDTCIADKDEEKGNEFFKSQKYQEAINHYTYYLKRKPEDAKVYSNRAACYVKLGALQEALKDAQKCIELDFTFAKGYAQKGEILYFMKDYEKALETCQNGLKFDAKDNMLLQGVRKCKQQIEKGKGEHVDVTRERMDHTKRYVGNESFKEKKYQLAIKEINESLIRDPVDALLYNNRAACYIRLGAMQEGLKDAEKCIELDPKLAVGYIRKGEILFFWKQYDKALETYQKGLNTDPEDNELLDGVSCCIRKINKGMYNNKLQNGKQACGQKNIFS
ncbi:hsp70-Hsp90 organizing protein-like [Rutidosis leptorrhynchoides]|uniref:hsp70-Hsp90 organizing protein-like n=1 Tax=Rutidosis leptorrhynchoides TaxID=125765 RepID=UPI003A98EC2B